MVSTDRDALLALYNATGGKHWTINANWYTDAALSQWHGVTVNDQDRVVALNLHGNNLTGHIPPQLGDLGALKHLYLGNNKLDGSIPPELGKLAALKELVLAANQLSGPIPPGLGNLESLELLSLHSNQLSGSIPPEVGNVASLRRFSLEQNQLSGIVSAKIGPGPSSVTRGRQPNRRSHIGRGWANSRRYSDSYHGSDRGSSRGSSAGSNHGSNHGRYDFDFSAARCDRGSSRGSSAGSNHGSNHGRYDFDFSAASSPPRASSGVVLGVEFCDGEFSDQATVGVPTGSGALESAHEGIKKVTILENLDVEEAPRTSKGGGVRLFVPRKSLRNGIGPITVEETAEVVNGNDGSVLVVMQVVHCLPAPCSFEAPLMLDFAVRDGRVWWWDRAALRTEVLREYQILCKQSEDGPWQEMDPEDVSVVWDDQGCTCLRARIKHFTWFSSARRTTNASANIVSRHWDKSVLVVNSTSSVAHVTPLPISFNTGEEATKSFSLTFCEAGINFETGKKTEQIMLPVNASSEIVPAGGMTELFLSGGAKEMKVIVCFLPNRNKSTVFLPSTQTASSSSGSSPAPRAASSTAIQTTATSMQQSTPTNPQASTTAAPSSGGSPPPGAELLARATSPISGAAALQSSARQDSPSESEEMIYCMTKVLPGRRRLTLLQEPLNRKIKIEKNARALETYAMMLADFGTASP